ncbi:MAG: hypothetical protein GXY22_09765, partial [Clostridiaceae bacterium]|nr:hypothetical protein [Clostridiaceae bacterium]
RILIGQGISGSLKVRGGGKVIGGQLSTMIFSAKSMTRFWIQLGNDRNGL